MQTKHLTPSQVASTFWRNLSTEVHAALTAEIQRVLDAIPVGDTMEVDEQGLTFRKEADNTFSLILVK